MGFLPNKKSKVITLLIIVACLMALALAFGPSPQEFFQSAVGPPPNDPEERKQWFSENIKSMDKTIIVIDEELPSWKELDKMNQTNQRAYPQFIKATQTYGSLPNLVEVLYFGDELKDLGINTQFIHANYWFKNKEFKFWYHSYNKGIELNQDDSKKALVHNILLAKKQGLAVILFPDYFQLEDGGMEKLNISDDLEDRLEKIALELAKIAEEYNVEYLVPVNQIEMILSSNGYGVEETVQRTNAFYANVVPKIRKVYSGKILYKMGGFERWHNYENISLEGADVFGFTGCYNRNRDTVEFVVSDIKTAASWANQLSQKYDVPWINAEFVVSDDSHFRGESISQKLPIEDYYKAGLEAFDTYGYATGATGFTIHSLLMSGKVYDTPAIPLIKAFFATKP